MRQDRLLTDLFGASDSISHVDHDAELEAASRRAKQQVLAMAERYRSGPPFGERLLVKAPFQTPDGSTEWMWVDVVRWEGPTVSGILQNDPFFVAALKAGSRVEVAQDSIFDYILERRDGTKQGNETGRIIERRETAKK